jgi:hypothetical protein
MIGRSFACITFALVASAFAQGPQDPRPLIAAVGDRILPGRDPIRFFEMKLERVGDTDWPLGTPVAPK